MTARLTTQDLYARLAKSLAKDAAVKSRRRSVTDETGTTITFPVSNLSVGLSIALEARTGEDSWSILDRLVSEMS